MRFMSFLGFLVHLSKVVRFFVCSGILETDYYAVRTGDCGAVRAELDGEVRFGFQEDLVVNRESRYAQRIFLSYNLLIKTS